VQHSGSAWSGERGARACAAQERTGLVPAPPATAPWAAPAPAARGSGLRGGAAPEAVAAAAEGGNGARVPPPAAAAAGRSLPVRASATDDASVGNSDDMVEAGRS